MYWHRRRKLFNIGWGGGQSQRGHLQYLGGGGGGVFQNVHTLNVKVNEVLAIRRIFSLVDMITNTKFSNCPNIFKIGVVRQ